MLETMPGDGPRGLGETVKEGSVEGVSEAGGVEEEVGGIVVVLESALQAESNARAEITTMTNKLLIKYGLTLFFMFMRLL
jgi:hypothetical protein